MLPGPTIGDSGTGMQAGHGHPRRTTSRSCAPDVDQHIELSMQEAMTYFMRTRISFGERLGRTRRFRASAT